MGSYLTQFNDGGQIRKRFWLDVDLTEPLDQFLFELLVEHRECADQLLCAEEVDRAQTCLIPSQLEALLGLDQLFSSRGSGIGDPDSGGASASG